MKIVFLWSILLVAMSSCCTYPPEVEEALKLSGNNRSELEKVLKHFKGTKKTDISMNYTPEQTSGKVFTEQYHCHPAPTGQGCILSLGDLQKLAFYYQKGRIDVEHNTRTKTGLQRR